MERFEIEQSKSVPKIIFDKENEIFSITGNSMPENPVLIYSSVQRWMKEYLKIPNKKTILEFNIGYINTGTCKCFLDLLELLDEAVSKGLSIHVNWYYQKGEEELRDAGAELLEMVSIPFSLLETD